MALTLSEQATLAEDQSFVDKVRQSAVNAAIGISFESAATAYHTERVNFGTLVLRTPDDQAKKVAYGVVGQLANATPNDGAINNAVSSVWNAFAGVVTQP